MTKIVVVVEDVESAREALQWALRNLFRYGDLITLLHVFSFQTRPTKRRRLRLQGYQLALSFKQICNDTFFNTKTEIIVREGDQEGKTIAAVVREIGASALLLGLHHHSFLYKLATVSDDIVSNLGCRVLAIKPSSSIRLPLPFKTSFPEGSTNMDFSEIEISRLQVENPAQKIPYRICPNPSAIIWRFRPTKSIKKNHIAGS